jgi:hypothetical protein
MILLLLYLEKISFSYFFLVVGALDFFSRIALGVYFALNIDAFGDMDAMLSRTTCPTEEEESNLLAQERED